MESGDKEARRPNEKSEFRRGVEGINAGKMKGKRIGRGRRSELARESEWGYRRRRGEREGGAANEEASEKQWEWRNVE